MYLRSFYRVYLTDYVTCMTVLKRVSTFLSLMLKKKLSFEKKESYVKAHCAIVHRDRIKTGVS